MSETSSNDYIIKLLEDPYNVPSPKKPVEIELLYGPYDGLNLKIQGPVFGIQIRNSEHQHLAVYIKSGKVFRFNGFLDTEAK